jgi:hypothetical protein
MSRAGRDKGARIERDIVARRAELGGEGRARATIGRGALPGQPRRYRRVRPRSRFDLHGLVGLLQQSLFGQRSGYDDVNNADRLCRDPAMRWVVAGSAPSGQTVSAGKCRFETEW